MLFLALLVPPLLMCAALGLGRYEERMLGPVESAPDPARQSGRHLHAVPAPAPDEDASAPGAPERERQRGRHRRRAA
ncbi:hypothetical protein [Streptomyces sp. MJM1172]|uniref:hypothetical protein n=1 Tax=Streptomyces sp. MJM1172 TaxID=1703926 RepID=UPI00093DF210|nr:hypothetical protein [Streptomyces sp. MJM1172]OKI61741.1 hypothetical protein AMK15_18050 [Streptomyces sp. MJM1172]